MPPHHVSRSDAFMFDIAQPPGWSYTPGDTIIGHLVRKIPVVSPDATVTLSFVGRSKVKIVYTRNNSKTSYRDEAQFINHHCTVFKGPIHLPEGNEEPLSWPISVNIPLEPHGSCRQGRPADCSLLPINEEHPGHHILPGTFYSEDNSFGNPDSSCFIEYYLVANLRYSHGGSWKSHESIHPINIRHPITNSMRLGTSVSLKDTRIINSQRLRPGMENADLSFKEHMQKFFSSSKVPTFKYAIHLTAPSAIQLNNPLPIPLQLEIIPINEGTSENIKDIAQNIQIISIDMSLRPYTQCIAPGNYITSQYSNGYQEKFSLGLQSLFIGLNSPLIINTGKANAPVHIGNTFQLTLTPAGLKSGTRQLAFAYAERVFPDFQTYNIKHLNSVKYTVTLKIAGEKIVHKFSTVATEILSSP